MKDKMMFYGVTLGKRYTRRQKEVFLNEVIKKCQESGIKTDFMTKHTKVTHICNLVIGDLKKAKKIVCAAYDTPSIAINPFYHYYPFNPKLNVKEESRNLIVEVVLGVILMGLCYFMLTYTMAQGMLIKILGILITGLVILFCFFYLFKGKANNFNFNRNSGAVVLIMQLIENVKNQDVAYVLLDKTADGNEGLKLLKENVNDHQLIILLDAISSGEKTVVAHNSIDVSDLLMDGWVDKQFDDTDNTVGYFKRCIMISRGEIINHRFVIKGTRSRNDYHFDYDGLKNIYEQLLKYLEG